MNYIHRNPVNAGFVTNPEDYRWSSERLLVEGKMSRESDPAYNDVVNSLGAYAGEEENDAKARPEA